MTDETAQAKIMELVKRVQAFKIRKVAIQSELDERYESWGRLMQADGANLGETKIRAGEKWIDIQMPWPQGYAPSNRPHLNTVATLPREHFDGEHLWELLAERGIVQEKFSSMEQQLKSLGIAAV